MAPGIVDHPRPQSLPILPLGHPNILIPAARISFPIPESLASPIIQLLHDGNDLVGAVPVVAAATPSEKDVYQAYGCLAKVVRLVRPGLLQASQPYTLVLQGLARFRLSPPFPSPSALLPACPVTYAQPHLTSPAHIPSDQIASNFQLAALRLIDTLSAGKGSRTIKQQDTWRSIKTMIEHSAGSPEKLAWTADLLFGAIPAAREDALDYLATFDFEARLQKATELFIKHTSIEEVSNKISQDVGEALSKQQKEFFLRQQLQAIQRELSRLTRTGSPTVSSSASGGNTSPADDEAEDADDLSELRGKVEAMLDGSEERKMGLRELKRLKRIPTGSVEHGVVRGYLEWLTSLPWPTSTSEKAFFPTPSRAFLTNARKQLDADHFGLEKIKRRLIEYLAVIRLRDIQAKQQYLALPSTETNPELRSTIGSETPLVSSSAKKIVNKGPILLIVGPPGTGKTSIASSLARALGRPFERISLGGVRDEAELRGHRRTYVASGPGAIVQALRRAGRADPVILLDEMDKVGQNNHHGDPSAALLEVLDPEQNHTFTDHYINIPVDLSQVLFIATANRLDTISFPLLDRCEVIRLPGYTYAEKMQIATRYLLPKQIQANALTPDLLQITDAALMHIATRYTSEAGVRNLEREIGAVARYKAVEWSEHSEITSSSAKIQHTDGKGSYNSVVDVADLEAILGIEKIEPEERNREEKRGVVFGMVVTGDGEGGLLNVESVVLPGHGRLRMTGMLGEVISESGEIALSWVKAHAYDLGLTSSISQDPLKHPAEIDIHLHLPAGAQRKDGPSAGVAMICAFVSLLTGAIVPTNVAMTGEVTLRGMVTPVGGIKEKVLGAHRAGITRVILPRRNYKDVQHDLSSHDVMRDIEFIFVNTVHEALDAAFGEGVLGWRRTAYTTPVESRL
ncbi:hypothetical protein BOTBODRAFT_57522 [Botryobasidium botryosum FD-172 SS1]|uniref:Lon protease homolog n=1 Tax=Botryobasidium botryosum (strain FD-172 SS1) TaxID=930990 RepID=A0A067MHY5_BOTB1|nr:hypothetical protein BOTBODRAFT_57522 [Botryobasidium botryosum FD-172 SS1]